jgi:hypothetical protein
MVSLQEQATETGPPAPDTTSPRSDWWWVPGAITVITIVSVIVVTLSQLHPSLLFSNTTTTGGDTGAHIAMPKFLESLMSHGHLTGWDPGWYDGFPLYTFYFTIPDAFIAFAGWIIPYGVAFKMGTILGSVLLPVTAWACGRFFRLRPPIPTLLAAATLPFLFDYTFTIYGGNLFSTLAGEYAYSFSLALALLFLGLFACAVREGRHRGWAAVVLAGCILSHIVPAFYALGGALVLTVIELLPARWAIDDSATRLWRNDRDAPTVARGRTLWWAGSTVGIGLLLSAWWLVPFGLEHAYTTSMGYTNLNNYVSLFFPEADAWALVLAGIGVVTAVLIRSRFGLTFTVLGVASALALVLDPQASLYNVRLLPLWFISVYLMAAWAFGALCIAVAEWWRAALARARDAELDGDGGTATAWYPSPPRWGPAAVSGAVLGLLAVMAAVVPPFFVRSSWLPVTLGANQVTNWSGLNYAGYEGQPSYPEYRAVMVTMQSVAKRYGCGRAMWEYSESENRFGTPESLMLLPYWTSGCVDSMEGLLFESSTTTPYHFIDQAEMSVGPSEPEVGLPYGPLDVALGVQHLQLLGVKYFMAETPTVEAQADADPALKLVATTGPWASGYGGTLTHTTWKMYLVRNAPLVTPLRNEPVVLDGVKPAPSSWLTPSLNWYADPESWNVELAQSGPPSWPRTSVTHVDPPVRPVRTTRVSAVEQSDSSVSFHVSRVGTPVLVKVSYFPNWHASGADGPWRVTPNLMVVVPTSHEVTLSYGRSAADTLGQALTLLGLVVLALLFVVPAVRRWWSGPRDETDGTETV